MLFNQCTIKFIFSLSVWHWTILLNQWEKNRYRQSWEINQQAKLRFGQRAGRFPTTLLRIFLADRLREKERKWRDVVSEFEIPPRPLIQSACQKGLLLENDSEREFVLEANWTKEVESEQKPWLSLSTRSSLEKQMQLLKNILYRLCNYAFAENFTLCLKCRIRQER